MVERGVGMVGGYVVTVSRYGVFTGYFMPDRYALYCQVSEEDHKE
jgi:hypothetical protein